MTGDGIIHMHDALLRFHRGVDGVTVHSAQTISLVDLMRLASNAVALAEGLHKHTCIRVGEDDAERATTLHADAAELLLWNRQGHIRQHGTRNLFFAIAIDCVVLYALLHLDLLPYEFAVINH